MTLQGWERIKSNCKSAIHDVILEPEQILKGYACEQPLRLVCSFKAYIGVCHGSSTITKFYVVKGTTIPLLSYQTSIDLKLLFIKGKVVINHR